MTEGLKKTHKLLDSAYTIIAASFQGNKKFHDDEMDKLIKTHGQFAFDCAYGLAFEAFELDH